MAYEYLFFVLPLTVFASDSANVNTSGNILSVKAYPLTAEGVTPSGSYTLTSYGYSSDGWGDKLTSFNGQAITYDSIGNPLTYYNGSSYSFTWQGRQLVGATTAGKAMSFEYNADGIRTSKTVNGVETKYYLNGSQIVAEANPNYSVMYIYDADGSPIGMQYRASSYAENVFDYYLFEKNLQGDIVAVYGSDGTKYLEYFYDAWGNFQIGYHNAGNLTPAALNPFTYRGYYYDSDLNLYYLNSRYYDQNIRRFINADSYVSTGQGILGNNMYAYCNNSPVNYVDFEGTDAILITVFGKGGLPIVGHSKLWLQDEDGKWFVTEYTGAEKSGARVRFSAVDKDDLAELLSYGRGGFFAPFTGGKSVYLKGDYTESVKLAEWYKDNQGMGNYNLLFNNCLDYTQILLKAGHAENKQVDRYISKTRTFVPIIFEVKTRIQSAVGVVKDTARSLFKKVWGWFGG